MESEINLPFITVRDGQPLHLVMKLTRAKLESLIGHLVTKTFESVKACLKDAKVDTSKINEVVLVGGMTRMPLVVAEVKKFFGKEPNKSVNPDEVVAVGAAVQAGVLTGETKDVVLLDVTPLTLGVETLGGVMTPLITRNTTIPTEKMETFSTAGDNQTQVEIHVLQGERPMARDNKSLGQFVLDGIPPAPRGLPQIEVSFDIDANGILHVWAQDKATGKKQSIRIEASSGLAEAEIQRMVRDAQQNADEDKKRRQEAETKNQADQLAYQTEKSLKEYGDMLDPQTRSKVEEGVRNVREALKSGSLERIKSSMENLNLLWHQAASQLYQKTGQAQPQSQAEPAAKPSGPEDSKDKAVEADYEVVK